MCTHHFVLCAHNASGNRFDLAPLFLLGGGGVSLFLPDDAASPGRVRIGVAAGPVYVGHLGYAPFKSMVCYVLLCSSAFTTNFNAYG